MGGKINFGSRIFPAKGSNKKLTQIKEDNDNPNLRFTTGSITNGLTAANVVVTSSINLPISTGKSFIQINQVFVICRLFDSSAGSNFDCSTSVYVRFLNMFNLDNNSSVNPLEFRPEQITHPLGMFVNLQNNQLVLSYSISGATVERLTGVVLAAGDQVTTRFGVSFY
jgi:hypothetical protein